MDATVVTQEELQIIQSMTGDFNKAKAALGDMALQKHELLGRIDKLKIQFSMHEEKLIEKYGKDAIINVQTGEITYNKEAK